MPETATYVVGSSVVTPNNNRLHEARQQCRAAQADGHADGNEHKHVRKQRAPDGRFSLEDKLDVSQGVGSAAAAT
jgi:hypothetical protein